MAELLYHRFILCIMAAVAERAGGRIEYYQARIGAYIIFLCLLVVVQGKDGPLIGQCKQVIGRWKGIVCWIPGDQLAAQAYHEDVAPAVDIQSFICQQGTGFAWFYGRLFKSEMPGVEDAHLARGGQQPQVLIAVADELYNMILGNGGRIFGMVVKGYEAGAVESLKSAYSGRPYIAVFILANACYIVGGQPFVGSVPNKSKLPFMLRQARYTPNKKQYKGQGS